jgi:zinc protease
VSHTPRVFTLLLLASLVAPTATSGAQANAPLPADTAVLRGRLPNGLRYLIRRNGKPEKRAELRLVVDAGSILESEAQLGVAHFVEHMAFNGTRRFPKADLVNFLERAGVRFGPDLNAYTSFDETVYMLQVPTDTAAIVSKGLDILEDWAHGLAFDSTEIRKERGVVVEEWRLRRGARCGCSTSSSPSCCAARATRRDSRSARARTSRASPTASRGRSTATGTAPTS